MDISRAHRREAARPRASAEFGALAEPALDLLELLELAWHDTYGEVAPPAEILEAVWVLADGDLGRLAVGARLAVTDVRDLRTVADEVRARA